MHACKVITEAEVMVMFFVYEAIAELLSTSMETETDHEVDTITANKEETSSVLPVLQDASTQASAPKMKSVSVTVRMKGKDKGNVAAYIKI